MKKVYFYIIGVLFLATGIFLAVFAKEPHFYSFSSVGVFLIVFLFYSSLAEKPLFHGWDKKQYWLLFFSHF